MTTTGEKLRNLREAVDKQLQAYKVFHDARNQTQKAFNAILELQASDESVPEEIIDHILDPLENIPSYSFIREGLTPLAAEYVNEKEGCEAFILNPKTGQYEMERLYGIKMFLHAFLGPSAESKKGAI